MSTPDSTTKTCNVCKQSFPATAEYFARNKTKRCGLNNTCKPCNSKKLAQWKLDNPERYKASKKEYQEIHRQEISAKALERERKNPELGRKRKAKYKKIHADKVRTAENKRRERDKERILLYKKEYYESHKELWRLAAVRRRATKAKADGYFTDEDVQKIYIAQSGKCSYCGIELNGAYEIDHIEPLSRGGSNWPHNLCCACKPCNRSKFNRTVEEWKEVRGW